MFPSLEGLGWVLRGVAASLCRGVHLSPLSPPGRDRSRATGHTESRDVTRMSYFPVSDELRIDDASLLYRRPSYFTEFPNLGGGAFVGLNSTICIQFR